MNVYQLSKKQKAELKANYYCEKNGDASWGDIANIDALVSDDEIYKIYANTDFVDDDFSCSGTII